ncbi:MAG: hypothetical protein ACJ8DJ_15510 [Gemmatimonadales bacterium]|jgi:hypothetical protein
MPITRCAWLVPALVAAMAGTAGAQAPTPRDTLHANFAPPLGPGLDRAPGAPGDTLERVPAPSWPDGALLRAPEEIPIPERIADLRLA